MKIKEVKGESKAPKATNPTSNSNQHNNTNAKDNAKSQGSDAAKTRGGWTKAVVDDNDDDLPEIDDASSSSDLTDSDQPDSEDDSDDDDENDDDGDEEDDDDGDDEDDDGEDDDASQDDESQDEDSTGLVKKSSKPSANQDDDASEGSSRSESNSQSNSSLIGVDPTTARGYRGKKPLYEGGVARVEDSSSEEDGDGLRRNTVGNIPSHWYADEDHIGYDLDGNRITRKQRRDELDEFLRKMDDPDYWTTIRDEANDRDVKLSADELAVLRSIQKARFPDPDFDPYPEYVDFFKYDDGIHPVSNAPEPKRRFVPSKWEAKRVVQLVRLIRAGKLLTGRPKQVAKENYLLWTDDAPASKRAPGAMAAPKVPPPGHEASYNPPDEYIPTPEELAAYEQLDPEDRPSFIPQKFPNLRSVPVYARGIQERFERCLDLYLCPRTRKLRVQVDAESLVPKLPRPAELAPFPSQMSVVFRGHVGAVCCVAVSAGSGRWLATGGEDGSVRVWEARTGRCVQVILYI